MAPTAKESSPQADTPMTDDAIPSVPVDALTVRDYLPQSRLSAAIVEWRF